MKSNLIWPYKMKEWAGELSIQNQVLRKFSKRHFTHTKARVNKTTSKILNLT